MGIVIAHEEKPNELVVRVFKAGEKISKIKIDAEERSCIVRIRPDQIVIAEAVTLDLFDNHIKPLDFQSL